MNHSDKLHSVYSDFRKILNSDETLRERINLNLNYTKKKLDELILEFVKFLIVKAYFPDQYILPSQEIDVVWHQFILHTEIYRDFCIRHFGFYIDHRPLNKNPEFKDTIRLLKRYFDIKEIYWKKSA